jgi:hypothetical protein
MTFATSGRRSDAGIDAQLSVEYGQIAEPEVREVLPPESARHSGCRAAHSSMPAFS